MIGNSVTSIGHSAFNYCTSLTSITIPNSVTTIKRGAFSYCKGLTTLTVPDTVTTVEAGDETSPGSGAFSCCTSLTNVTIGNGLTNIGYSAFSECTNLSAVFFKGNAPTTGKDVFERTPASIYYLPGTTGWGSTFADHPTALWVLPYPIILTTAPNFGIQTNAFGFRISWATNASFVVEASTTLAKPVWSPVSTNTLTDGWSDFSDAEWMNYPARFYRVGVRE